MNARRPRPTKPAAKPAARRKPKRWGLRTLVYLTLAAASIITSNWMRLTGNDDYILLPFIGLVVGLIGAAVCSIRGLLAWNGKVPR